MPRPRNARRRRSVSRDGFMEIQNSARDGSHRGEFGRRDFGRKRSLAGGQELFRVRIAGFEAGETLFVKIGKDGALFGGWRAVQRFVKRPVELRIESRRGFQD